jgi:hypothetical protein
MGVKWASIPTVHKQPKAGLNQTVTFTVASATWRSTVTIYMLLCPRTNLLWAEELKSCLVIVQCLAHDAEHLCSLVPVLDVGQQCGNCPGLNLGTCRR